MFRQTTGRASKLLRRKTNRRGYHRYCNEEQGHVVVAPIVVMTAAALMAHDTINQHTKQHEHGLAKIPPSNVAVCEMISVPRLLSRRNTLEFLEQTAAPNAGLLKKYITTEDAILGIGTFGRVSKATCRATSQEVAIKALPKECIRSNAAVQRELHALLKIRQAGGHPNLAALREYFDDASHDSYYLVLELVPGGELFDALCREGPLCEADAARFVRQLASALQFMHALDLVHADLKPENCLLSEPNTKAASIKLVDFGCCETSSTAKSKSSSFWGWSQNPKSSSPNPASGVSVTPEYCPPEVLAELRNFESSGDHASRPNITPAYDMWSLGVILFIMLMGAHPFDLRGNATDEEIAEDIMQTRLLTHTPVWHEYAKDLSPEVQTLLHSLMHPDPTQRMTAEELLQTEWVRGLTPSSQKLRDSDRRLTAYRKYQTRVAAQFFKSMLQHAHRDDEDHGDSDISGNTSSGAQSAGQRSLLETAFSKLQSGRGYISSKALNGDTSLFGLDAKLNMAEATELLNQTHMKDHYFPAGKIIYNEGDPGDVMYFIISGQLEAKSKDGFIKKKKAGDFFGEDVLSGSDKNAYAFTAQCITPVHAIQILRKDYEKYIHHDEDLELIMKEYGRIRRRERARIMLNMEKKAKSLTYTQGDIIFERGTPGGTLFVLKEGKVDISVDGHKVRSLRKGETMGEHAAYHGDKAHNETAQCTSSSCTLGSLAGKELRKALAKNADLEESFHDIMVRRDFRKALCLFLGRPFPETEEEMKAAFRALVPQDGPQELDLNVLRKVMKSFDPSYSEEDVSIMMRSLDLTGSQTLTWKEFKTIFTMARES